MVDFAGSEYFYRQMEYQYFDPRAKDLTEAQKNYIKTWLKGFDEIMSGTLLMNQMPTNDYRIRSRIK
jgi:uncharacterized protein (DUF924 family)